VTAARALAALLLLAAAGPAAAYKQTCDGAGVCLAWRTRSITWKLNTCRPSSSPSCQANPVEEIAKASFQAWQDVPCSDLTFTYGGASSSIIAAEDAAEHLVVFRPGWCSEHPDAVNDPCYDTATCGNKYDCFDDEGGLGRNTLALTSVRYQGDGTIVDADTEIVDWDGGTGAIGSPANGVYVTCYTTGAPASTCTTFGQADCVYYDLQNTLTHEIGHFLGLAHPCGSGSGSPEVPCTSTYADRTMYPFEVPGEIAKRTLAADDVAGICALYPGPAAAAVSSLRAPASFSPEAVVQSPATGDVCMPRRSSGGGCSTGGGPGAAGLLALAAIARLRRRA
jgi:MYXO-CTERM domain-containing protein